jgi:hypothetical protein
MAAIAGGRTYGDKNEACKHRKSGWTSCWSGWWYSNCDKPKSCCVVPPRYKQPFNPPVCIRLADGTNGVEVNSNGVPASYVKVTLTNVPSGYSVANGQYLAWCLDASLPLCPRDYPPCIGTIYKPLIFSSCDPSALYAAGLPAANWDRINYILNNRAMYAMIGYNVSEIQAAIWRLVRPNPTEEASILSGNYGFGFPAGVVGNVDWIVNDANQNGRGFVPKAGQITAVILQLPAFLQTMADPYQGQAGQPLIIEVRCGSSVGSGDCRDDDDDDKCAWGGWKGRGRCSGDDDNNSWGGSGSWGGSWGW